MSPTVAATPRAIQRVLPTLIGLYRWRGRRLGERFRDVEAVGKPNLRLPLYGQILARPRTKVLTELGPIPDPPVYPTLRAQSRLAASGSAAIVPAPETSPANLSTRLDIPGP